MDNAIYATLSRQSGLAREFRVVANNIANANTTGFKAESGVFSEHVARLQDGGVSGLDAGSLSMGRLSAHASDFSDGALRETGGAFDLALSGEGFFQVQGRDGVLLTRAGHFQPDAEGRLVTATGEAVLDDGGGEIVLPPDTDAVAVARDGSISAGGVDIARIGVVAADPLTLSRAGNGFWVSEQAEPVEAPTVVSGFLEGSNVDPVLQMARMIEVQRHYDAGQSLLELEHERIRSVSTTIRNMG